MDVGRVTTISTSDSALADHCVLLRIIFTYYDIVYQLVNTTEVTHTTAVIADKCFIVWNDTGYGGGSTPAWNDTGAAVTRRLACPHGWTYDRDPIQTSIVTDVSIHEQRPRAVL